MIFTKLLTGRTDESRQVMIVLGCKMGVEITWRLKEGYWLELMIVSAEIADQFGKLSELWAKLVAKIFGEKNEEKKILISFYRLYQWS